jgi:hypothetical protein
LVVAFGDEVAGEWMTACDGAAERPAAVTAAIAPIVARRFTYYLQVSGSDDAIEARKAHGGTRSCTVRCLRVRSPGGGAGVAMR